jgi:SAM-dependent methyltransferase
MDLRTAIRSPADIQQAKALIVQDHFFYQPFRFADDLEVGGGYEFINRRPGAGMVYWPAYENERGRFPGPPLRPIDSALVGEFRAANDALRQVYDGFIDQICERVAGIRGKSVADVGCNNGYMPAGFALRGVRDAVGYDRNDHSGGLNFLNRLLGTRARFVHAQYDLVDGRIRGCPSYDVVISMSVLQHMPEPLRHLHFLRSITHEALFLMTNAWDDDEYLIRYGEPNATSDFAYPWCFDNSIYLSDRLLRKALEKAGFTRIVDLEFRLPSGTRHAEARGSHDYATSGAHHQKLAGRALLCFVDGPARGAQVDLRAGSNRLASNRTLALLRRTFPRLSWWVIRRLFRQYRD